MKSLILLTFLASSLSFAETKTIAVSGMTCGSCVKSVKKNVCEGLNFTPENCKVEIGTLTLTGENIDMNAVEAALKKGGYEIAATPAGTAATTQQTESKPATTPKKK